MHIFNVVEERIKKERLCEKDARILLLKLITYGLLWETMITKWKGKVMRLLERKTIKIRARNLSPQRNQSCRNESTSQELYRNANQRNTSLEIIGPSIERKDFSYSHISMESLRSAGFRSCRHFSH